MNKQPKVSVVVPVYNVEAYLEQCLDSILHQTMEAIEIICVDDGSTDGSIEILRRYEQNTPGRVKCILHPQNVSASQCRKDGVMASSGEYVMFVDGDDYLEEDACRLAYETIREKGVDVLQFGTVVENCGNLPEGRIQSNQRMLKPYTEEVLTEGVLEACFLEKKISVNIWNKIFAGDLCRTAFGLVEDGSFPKANDLYAIFHLLYLAKSFAGAELTLYHYCFGRGMTGRQVMDLENFERHCQGARVVRALRTYADGLPEEERLRCTAVVDQIEQRLVREQLARWMGNLDVECRSDGFRIMCEVWGRGTAYILSAMANANYYNRQSVADKLKGEDCLRYTPRKIRTVALYYRCIFNGGAQRVVAELCNLFAAQEEKDVPKYRVVLVTDEAPCEGEYPLSPRVIREFVPDRTTFPKENYYTRAMAWYDIIERHQVDVVFNSMWVDSAGFWDMLIVKSHPSHPAYVFHAHNCCGLPYRMNKAAEMRIYYGMADGVVTLSESDRRFWLHVNPNVYLIPNPCELTAKKKKNACFGKKKIVWVGRISYEKQPTEMIRIMKHVREEIPDAVCHMVGDGSEELVEKLRSMIEAEGLEGQVILEGFQDDPMPFYEDAAVLVVTSRFEGWALILFEGAAFGTPTLTYDLPWLEYYNLMDGWATVPQLDAKAAADKIVKLLSDQALWKDRSDRLYRSFERYKKTDIMTYWDRVFDSLETEKYPEETVDPQEGIILQQITQFQAQGIENWNTKLRKANAEKSELHERMKQAYAEKSKLHERMLQAYAEKAEARERMLQAFDERTEARNQMRQAYAEKTEVRERMLQAYAEKAELHERMLKAYAEKAETRERMLKAYAEKEAVRQEMKSAYAQRDQYRDELRTVQKTASRQAKERKELQKELEAVKAELARAEQQNRALRRSGAYRVGRVLTWPVRKLKALFGGGKKKQ